MIRYFFRRLRKNERGAALLEFAMIIPVLLLLVMGILEFGWVFNSWITLTGAAREGARAAVVDENADVEQAVWNHTSTFEINPIVDGPTLSADGESITVTVTGSLQPLVGFFRTSNYEITVDATMRREYFIDD